MNFKVLAFVVALAALQALCVRAQEEGPEPADYDYPQNNLADSLAADVQTLSASLNTGDKVNVQGKLGLAVSTQSITGLLQAIQRMLERAEAVVDRSYQAVIAAVNQALTAAQTATDNAINGWENALQAIIERNQALNATLTACRAQQPSLQSVGDALRQDVQVCVEAVQANSTAALNQLQTIRDEAGALADSVQTVVATCRAQGWAGAAVCILNSLPELTAEGISLIGDASAIAAKVTGTLAINIPIQSAACVGGAVAARTQEANQIIAAVRQCVATGLAPTTTAAA